MSGMNGMRGGSEHVLRTNQFTITVFLISSLSSRMTNIYSLLVSTQY